MPAYPTIRRALFLMLTVAAARLGVPTAHAEESPSETAKALVRRMAPRDVWLATMKQVIANSVPEASPAEIKSQTDELTKCVSYEWQIDMMARSYAAAFDEDELKSLAAFYDTPVGKKFLLKQREVAEDISRHIGRKVTECGRASQR